MTAEGLGPFIKRRRAELNMTQQQLALKIGVSQGYLSQIENGSRKWPQKYIHGISRALLVPEPSLAVTAGMIGQAEDEESNMRPIELALKIGKQIMKTESQTNDPHGLMIGLGVKFLVADEEEKMRMHLGVLKALLGFVALTSDMTGEDVRSLARELVDAVTDEEIEEVRKAR